MLNWLQRKLRTWTPEHRRIAGEFPTLTELKKRAAEGEATGMVVGFFTKDSIYETEKDRLLRSVEAVSLTADIVEIASQGSWVRNAGMKPGVLIEMRRKHRGPLLYVDVDAIFHRNPWPFLMNMDCDFAAHYEPEGNLLSGTLLINDTPAAAELLQEWAQGCLDAPEEWDQRVLEKVIADDARRTTPCYRIERLPVSYCWIFDKISNESSGQIYIEHLQASREKKKRKRWFGRVGKALARRRDRVKEIERILFER